VELDAADAGDLPGGLSVAASSFIITIARVAEMLGEDEDLLFEIACDMTMEDGCIDVFGVEDEYFVAFTPDGIDRLIELLPLYKPPH